MGTAKVEGELWGAKAKDWADFGESTTAPLWRSMLEAVQVGPDDTFLDLGCGAGGASVLAASRGAAVTGIDASQNLLAIAQDRVPEGQFHEADLEALAFGNGSFDVVFAANSLQYAGDQGRAVREAMRVRRSGGRFIVGMWCEPDRCGLSSVMRAVKPLLPQPAPGSPEPPPTLSDRDNLFRLLQSNGASPKDEGEVECVFEFADESSLLRGLNSAGVVVMLSRLVGQEALDGAIIEGCAAFRQKDGGYKMPNWFRWVRC
ncbi:MAG: class I SAM-dependent methyltransferase [Armatimonadetes bacterium]|nr:class I SAM-dependent methyltransferase [Armatimonadota bacterium]